jgi:hypothetical protein
VTTKVRSGSINVKTLGYACSSLSADCVSLGIGLVSVIVLSFIFPEKRSVKLKGVVTENQASTVVQSSEKDEKELGKYSDGTTTDVYRPTTGDTQDVMVVCALTPAEVRSQRTLTLSPSGIGSIGFMILLPFTLYGTGHTISRGFFKAYVVVDVSESGPATYLSCLACVGVPRRALVRLSGHSSGSEAVIDRRGL